jgi:hypothetical protein
LGNRAEHVWGIFGGSILKSLFITITNFEKYKGRADVQMNSWFRLSNRFLEDSDFFDFTHEEKLVWVYLLSIASQKNTARIHVSHQHAHQVSNLSAESVNSAIEKLNKLGCLKKERTRTLRGRYVDDTQTCATEQTEQNIHTQHASANSGEFAEFYAGYPRKIGKSAAKRAYLRLRKGGVGHEEILLAREKFRAHHESAGTESKYLPYPATFLGNFRDYLEPDYGQTESFKKEKSGFQVEEKL